MIALAFMFSLSFASASNIILKFGDTDTTGSGTTIIYNNTAYNISHNDLTNKQGGSAGQYYHLTQALYDLIVADAGSWIKNTVSNLINYYTKTEINAMNTSIWAGINSVSGGLNGTDGINGTNGVDGINGSQGVQGIDGINGSAGAGGLNGTNGLNGVDGVNGSIGLSGIDGVNGSAGSSGVDGINGTNAYNITNNITTYINTTEIDPLFTAENSSLWAEAKNKYNSTYAGYFTTYSQWWINWSQVITSGSGQAYDQDLNKSANVVFNTMNTTKIKHNGEDLEIWL